MTDKEIEKALEICGKLGDCVSCPCDGYNCIQKDLGALDYINRLKAEKEQIRKNTAKEILRELFDDAKEMAKDKNYDFAIAYIRMKTILRFKAKEYGVEVGDD